VLFVAIGEPREDFLAKRGPDLIDLRLLKAIEHPLRVEILNILREGDSSPARIQRQINSASLNLVSHHIKVLKELGCIELVETISKRGAKESIYRAVGPFVIPDEAWAELTPKLRVPLIAAILRAISNDLAKSLGAGKLDEIDDLHFSRSPLKLDQEGWSEIIDLLGGTLTEILAIGDRSLKRVEASDEAPMPMTVVILQFPTAENEGRADRDR
jgi:DNA-binding transcriptional ArsR family regulator